MAKKQKYLWQRRLKRTHKRIKLMLVPHRDNHYRPHLVRRYGLLAVLAVVVGVQLSYNFTQTGSVLGRVVTVTPAGLLASTNQQRAAHELAPLRLDPRLSEAAGAKAQDMLAAGYWDHVSPGGVEPWYWIEDAGYEYQQAGENLARNFSTAEATIAAWMNSDPHKDNVLNQDFKDVGFATAYGRLNGEAVSITVAMYGVPVSQVQVAGATVDRSVHEAVTDVALTPAARIGVGLQSLTPAAVTGLALLFVATTVAVTAHIYRRKLPKNRRESWYKNHGAVKATGLMSVVAFIILIYGGGQI